MEAILQVVVQLIDLDTGLVLKSLLIVIDYVQLVFVVLQQHPAMVYQISHVALQVQHYASHFLYHLVDGKNLMAHFLELRGTIAAHSYARGLVQVGNLIHVVVRTRVSDACCS